MATLMPIASQCKPGRTLHLDTSAVHAEVPMYLLLDETCRTPGSRYI